MQIELGKRVAYLRTKQGLTQVELAKRMGVHQTMISKIEQGERLQPVINTLAELAAALNVVPADLLTTEQLSEQTEATEIAFVSRTGA